MVKNIIQLLLEDHAEFRSLFDRYANDPQDTCKHLKRDLTMHTELEERVLYPEVQAFAAEEVEHARKEHDDADRLMKELEKDPSNSTIFFQLRDAVLHHVEEEEEDLFPRAAEALGDEKLTELGHVGAQVKEELLAELK